MTRLPAGIFLWDDGAEGLAKGVSPEFLGAAHPLWESDVRQLGPFERVTGPQLGGRPQALWRAATDTPYTVVLAGPATSALDVAWKLDDAGWLPDLAAVVVVSQSAGRGRLRRPWNSPPGNLYAAWKWPSLSRGKADWSSIASLLAGLCMVHGLQDRAPELRLKWPNDLLAEGAKIGGLLVEERPGAEGPQTMVGIGLNLVSAPGPDELRKDASVPAGYLRLTCSGFGPASLWLEVATAAGHKLQQALEHESPAVVMAQLEALMEWLGVVVRVRAEDGEEMEGRLAGLAPDGGLRLVQDGTERILYSGSILPLY